MTTNAVSSIRGIGPNSTEKLAKLGIYTVFDLLLHLPTRYQDRTVLVPLHAVREGAECLTQGEISAVTDLSRRRQGAVVQFVDQSATATMRLFHCTASQREALQAGRWLRVFGKPDRVRSFIHPEYRVFNVEPDFSEPEYRAVYRTAAGITSPRLRDWINKGLEDATLLSRHEMAGMRLAEALQTVHRPSVQQSLEDVEPARARIALEEVLAYLLVQRQQRAERQNRSRDALPLPRQQHLGSTLLKKLGFKLTAAQRRCTTEVLTDLSKNTPMRRLLQGDVGSGKTVIAAFAAIRAAENGAQTAVMAPTELLAEQHFETFSQWLEPLGIRTALLTSQQTTKSRQLRTEALASGEDLVVVGTQALIQRNIRFQNLALAIVDEQHRFGVHQRMQLRGKGQPPHQLIMTATPIPRTLAMSMFADLEVSTIDELPPGRQAIATTTHSSVQRSKVVDALRRTLQAGGRAYWVCVAIDPSAEDIQALEEVFATFKRDLREFKIGAVHGRMKRAEKAEVMTEFRRGGLQLLVATTVVEVGIDVPEANLMVIENAERLGLAQLHQLRGRVGRGTEPGRCMLLFQNPITDVARARLRALRETNDGFKLAEADLLNRGPGQLFGTRQSGTEQFRIATLVDFVRMFPDASEFADELVRDAPEKIAEILQVWSRADDGSVSV